MDQQGMQLMEGDAGAPAVGQRDRRVVGAQDLVEVGAPNRASIARSVSRWPPCAAGSISAPAAARPEHVARPQVTVDATRPLGRPGQLADAVDDGLDRARVGRREHAVVPRPLQVGNEPSLRVPAPPVRRPRVTERSAASRGAVGRSGAGRSEAGRRGACGASPVGVAPVGVLSSGALSSGVLSSGSDAMYPGHGAPKPGCWRCDILGQRRAEGAGRARRRFARRQQFDDQRARVRPEHGRDRDRSGPGEPAQPVRLGREAPPPRHRRRPP